MVYEPLKYLPSSEELPDSDDTPVDNEFQDLISGLLKAILFVIWKDRTDWFFGIDMGIYHEQNVSPPAAIIPDGFLSLSVERFKIRAKGRTGRLSYVLWEENYVIPILVLEVVSQSYGEEYGQKKLAYAELGVLYYVIYDSERYQPRRGEAFEVYKLVDGVYVRWGGEPVWMSEIGLGIGRGQGTHGGWMREWLYWYDQKGNRYPTSEEIAQQERQRAIAAEQQLDYLKAKLQELGLNPENL